MIEDAARRLDELPQEELGERMRDQIGFLLEVDRLKQVLRQTQLLDGSRKENDAEHSWHLALMALVLAEHGDPEVDLLRVVRMLLVHDVVEIDAGDTFCYDPAARSTQGEREERAAERLFGLLPEDQARDLRAAWEEFERRESPEARYAAALDRLQPLLHNFFTRGGTWREHGVGSHQVRQRNAVIADGSASLWRLASHLIDTAVAEGFLADSETPDPGADPGLLERIETFETHRASTPMTEAVSAYRERFEVDFETLTHFPRPVFEDLHRLPSGTRGLPPSVTVASATQPSILDQVGVLTEVANTDYPTTAQRETYFRALQEVYARLPADPRAVLGQAPTLCVAPEREGRMLAEAMDWCRGTHNVFPQAKRIPFEGGLLVGLGGLREVGSWQHCVLIDGAIASGSTLMAILHRLRNGLSRCQVFSVHATHEGLWALHRFCLAADIELRAWVGHATAGMSDKYYALDPADPGRLAVGDLGDTISSVAEGEG